MLSACLLWKGQKWKRMWIVMGGGLWMENDIGDGGRRWNGGRNVVKNKERAVGCV